MKKILSALFLGSALLGSFSANAQLADGSTAPDFTLTDISGTTHNLYSYLTAGKTVIIDCSATWCGPCWSYHNTHALKELYEKHGPTGSCTQDVVVLFIEGDETTTGADLNGTGSSTQGDWVSGTPYPIIDLPVGETWTTDYAIGYFPTIYKICPDKKVYEVGQQSLAVLETKIAECSSFTIDGQITTFLTAPLSCVPSTAPSFTFKNGSTTTITAATFTYDYDGGTSATQTFSGSLAAGATTTINLPSTTLSAGAHTLNVEITDVNGGVDGNKLNNCYSYTLTVSTNPSASAPLMENFAATSFPYADWIINNPDNGITWERVTTSGGSLKYDAYSNASTGAIDEVILKPVDLTTLSTPNLKFDVAYAPYNAIYFEKLEVFVSSDCGATWTSVYDKSNTTLATAPAATAVFTPTATQWRTDGASLAAFASATRLYVKFKVTNGYGNNLYLDNINISNSSVSVEESASILRGVTVYPNPVNNIANVNVNLVDAADIIVNVTNSVGQVLVSKKVDNAAAGANTVAIDFSAFESGVYNVVVNAGGQNLTTRVIK